jgi:replication factor C large subunit
MNWTEKYAPKKISEIEGQNEALKSLTTAIAKFKKGRAILLYGPVGSGKTSSAYAVAKETNKEIFEVNASDARNKESMETIVGSAIKQQSLLSFGKGKIILIDEVDGISGQEDRGGIAALTALVEESGYPIVITANDPYAEKLSALRKKCTMIEFKQLGYADILKKLEKICKSEGITYNEELLRDLSRRSGGDMRAAITDLQLTATEGKLEQLEFVCARDRTENMANALMKIFKTTSGEIARDALINVDEDIDKQILWIEENLPKEYEGEDLARGFDALSKADVYLGRIKRWQHWRFLVYAGTLISAGVALSKRAKYAKIIKYTPTTRILKLWIAKMKYQKRKEIAGKIARKCHTSENRAVHDILPAVRQIIKNGDKKLAKEFDLTSEETEWLAKG